MGLFSVILAAALYFEGPVKNFFYLAGERISTPFVEPGQRVAFFLSSFKRGADLARENEDLAWENERLKGEVASLVSLRRENEELRKALEVNLGEEFNLSSARVVFRNFDDDFFLINKGEEDGVREGLVVIDSNRAFVGWVDEVYGGFSRVSLLSQKGKKLAVTFEEGGLEADVEGEGDSIFLRLIPQEKELKEGEIVLTSGLGRRVPQGLLVGEVSGIRKVDVEPYQEATIKPAGSVERASVLFLITDY